MARSRATSGADLALELTGRPLRASLEDQLRDAIRDGRLRPGTRLPSSRALATELGVGRNSVADALAQLVAEGWLVARHGAGTWVAERPDDVAPAPPSRPAPDRPARFDLRPGIPDLSAFPRAAWVTASRRALTVAPDRSLGYGDPRGLRVLRDALAGYLGRARRVAVDPERIVVCAGIGHGLALVCGLLRRSGATTVAVEVHGHRAHQDLIARSGLAVTTVPVDGCGAVVDALGEAAAVVLTPAHQFPMGVVLDPARRRQALRWAAANGAILLEDDYDGEFRYDRQAVGAMQSLAPDQVVYAGTVSKSLAPGLRMGWLALPAALLDDLVDVKRIAGAHTSAVDQLTLAELITSGAYDRQIRRSRLVYRRRRDRLVEVLAKYAPTVATSGIAAGLHVLAHLPGRAEEDVIAVAARHGLVVDGLGAFTAPGHEHPPALVIGYATPPDHAYTAALARLDAVLAEVS
jgi:GntR family transcriptional regulator/MocR family aminotransferase